MGIITVRGDIFDSGADIIVNPCNCKGVAGAGLSLEFKKRYPDNFKAYKEACDNGILRPGWPFWYREEHCAIVNFPTKDHWRNPSRYQWIEEGAENLARDIFRKSFTVAMPKLGCGRGGLEWPKVRKILQNIFCYDSYNVVVWTLF